MTDNEIMKETEDFVVLDEESCSEAISPSVSKKVDTETARHVANIVNTSDSNNKEYNIKVVDAISELARRSSENPEMAATFRLYAEDINRNSAIVNDNYNKKNEIIGKVVLCLGLGVWTTGVCYFGYSVYKNPKCLQNLHRIRKK